MEWFEEKCHQGKEEHLEFARNEANEIRMLGTYMGWKHDMKQRVSRMMKACFVLKRLKSSKLTKRAQARVVEACAEPTALFDAQIRPWHRSEINQIQRAVYKAYRYIWSNKRNPPLIEMVEKGANMFEVREQLGMTMIETKITKRTLERIGHVLTMNIKWMIKQIALGWSTDQTRQTKLKRQTLIEHCRKCLKDAGVEPDHMEQ